MRTKTFTIAAATALAILSPASAIASGGTVDTSYGNTVVEREDDDRFPWGLLGLLGLLGLIPRKKKETVIDNRTTTR
jgi:hypothetical protein